MDKDEGLRNLIRTSAVCQYLVVLGVRKNDEKILTSSSQVSTLGGGGRKRCRASSVDGVTVSRWCFIVLDEGAYIAESSYRVDPF